MASKNGYVAPKVAEGHRVRRILKGGPGSILDGYVVQALEVVYGEGLQLVTAARQPHSAGGKIPDQVMTAQEVWFPQNADGTVGRLALTGVPTIISPYQAPETNQVAKAIHTLNLNCAAIGRPGTNPS